MDSLKRRKLQQIAMVLVCVGGLAGMIAYNAWRPDEQERQADAVSQTILSSDWEQTTAEDRERLREQWDRLSPAIKEKVWERVSRQRLQELRQRTSNLTAEERVERIQEAVRRMQQHRQEIKPEERERIRQRLNSEEGRAMIKRLVAVYQNELTAKEREELDPLFHEWIYQIENMSQNN